MNIGFIGIGNMGGAILRGLLKSEEMKTNEFYICGGNKEKTKKVALSLNVKAFDEIEELVEKSDVFFIGVKPNKFSEVLPHIKKSLSTKQILISMAAGITIEQLEKALGQDKKIIRIMPNTPAQVSEAMVSVSRNERVSDEELAEAVLMLSIMGNAQEVSEDLIHGVIGVSGSSPAYTFMYIDALAKAACENGISKEKARIFAAQAVLGAAKLVLSSDEELETLVDKVCSPGGTTIEAVDFLRANGFEKIVMDAAQAAVDKSKLMSGEK